MKRLTARSSVFVCLGLLSLALSSGASARALPDFTELVENNNAAVVNISTTQKAKSRSPRRLEMPDLPEGNPLNELFRHYFGEEDSTPREEQRRSLGSGFIISADGYVITNEHVIRDASEIRVRLVDRRELVAEVIGADERSDVALLKIEADNLPIVKIGKAENLKQGEWVLAIGSPFDFDHSVTAGIVSAKGRSLPNGTYVPFIQTDVAINPGNSGGPLFNLDGEVIGVNSQIYTRTGGFMGLSFAIPIEVAMDVVEQIKTKGRVTRGWLGVLIQEVTAELAESYGMEKPHGALISRVLEDSPAEAAGFKVEDIIIEFNDQPVERSRDLPPMVGVTGVNKTVPVKVLRKGKQKILKVKIGELPEDEELASAEPRKAEDNRLAVTVTDVTAQVRQRLDIEEGGALVSELRSGPASRAGIREGDVIMMLNSERIKDAAHFAEIVKALPDKRSVPVLVHRRNGPIFLALKLGEEK